VRVFVSYAHEDRPHLDQFRRHTAGLRRHDRVKFFDDKAIRAGQRWRPKLAKQLDEADIVVLLVTASFVDSEFCYDVEFKRALEREATDGCIIIPVNVGPVDLDADDPLSNIQYVPQDPPITERSSGQESAWTEVAAALRSQVDELLEETPPAPTTRAVSTRPGNVVALDDRRRSASGPGRRGSSRQSTRPPVTGHTPRGGSPTGSWHHLAEVLRATRFDAAGWQSLALSTRQLRRELELSRPPHRWFPDQAPAVAEELRQALVSAVAETATPATVRRTCETSEYLRDWLLAMLSDSRN
jgi:TIR domain